MRALLRLAVWLLAVAGTLALMAEPAPEADFAASLWSSKLMAAAAYLLAGLLHIMSQPVKPHD